MKASEVLKRYAAGERNFQGVNLRGQSFKGQNLSGADFSEADIRSADFTDANLTKANFTGVQAGLSYFWLSILAIFTLILSALFAFLSSLAGVIAGDNFAQLVIEEFKYISAITIVLVTFVLFAFVIIRQGLVGAFTMLLTLLVVGTVGWISIVLGSSGFDGLGAIAVTIAWGGIGTLFQMFFGATFGVLFGILFVKSKFMSVISVTFGSLIVLVVIVVTEKKLLNIFPIEREALFVAVIIVLMGSLLGIYIAWSTLDKNRNYTLVHDIAINYSTFKGTNFRCANLTEANFSNAKLKSTDFRNSMLTRVRWYGAKMLDRVRAGNTYLKSTQVRQWLVGKGVDKNFDGQKLQGINLQGADLTDASFISSDLSEANLQDTDLSRAKLVQTLLDKTDFTGANLTGAFIQDWGITSNTVLSGVRCKYIFMRLPTDENPDPYRKPDNRSEMFEDGDFGDFIKPFIDTLDLYHNQGVDPRAIAISWKKLLENNPDANLRFTSMEVKGENNLLLKLKTSPNANLSRLSAEYFDTYNQIKTLSEQEIKLLLIEKDSRIRRLETMVATALEKPSIYTANLNVQNVNSINNSGAGAFNIAGNIEKIGDITGSDYINIAGNIKQIENYQEVESTNIAGNIKRIENIKGNNNQIYIAGNTRIETITSGLIEGEIENIQNVQTAELIESNRKDIGIEIIKGSGMLKEISYSFE